MKLAALFGNFWRGIKPTPFDKLASSLQDIPKDYRFSVDGFYDGTHHIVLTPDLTDNPFEVVAHEATHAKLVAQSSLGLFQQIATFILLSSHTDTARAKASAINVVIERNTLEVQEAVAWLVTELVSANGSGNRAPPRHRDEVANLRQKLEMMPGRGFDALEDCHDDFDPLFTSVILIAQAAGAFALSPPGLTKLVHDDAGEFDRSLQSLLNERSQQPMERFHWILEVLSQADYSDVKTWMKWVRRWRFVSSAENCPVRFAAPLSVNEPWLLQASNDLVAERLGSTVVVLINRLVGGEQDGQNIKAAWHTFQRYFTYEPHVDPYYQTCIVERPRLITPYTFKGDELPRELYDNAMHVNVAIGEEKDFVFARDREALVTLSFQAGDNRRIFWKRTPDEAQRFLTRWVQQGKAIVTSSNGYSFAEGDLEEHPVLRGLPHTVVAISDLRSVWTRIAFNGGQGLSGSKTVSVAVMSTPEGSTQYAFLVLKPEEDYPIVIIPCLMQTAVRAVGVVEEVYSPKGYSMSAMPDNETRDWARRCEPSFRAAFSDLRGYFRAGVN